MLISSYASALARGSEAGPSLTSGNPRIGWFNDADALKPGVLTIGAQGEPLQSNFVPEVPFQQKYLGVRFERDGALHYGWVGISGYANIGQEIYIHAWAYESEPDKAIIVGQIPEPGAGLLAAASALLMTLRRKRNPTRDKRRLEWQDGCFHSKISAGLLRARSGPCIHLVFPQLREYPRAVPDRQTLPSSIPSRHETATFPSAESVEPCGGMEHQPVWRAFSRLSSRHCSDL